MVQVPARGSRRRRAPSWAAVAVACALASAAASAQPRDEGAADAAVAGDGGEAGDVEARRATAAAAFAEAVAAYDHGDFARAAEGFGRAYEALPHPAPLYNMARAHEGAGDVARAIEAYERYLREGPGEADAAEARARLDALRVRPVGVFLSSDPDGARVRVDDEAQEVERRTPVVLRLAPGPHVILVEHEGYQPAARRLALRPGEDQTVGVALTRLPAPPRGDGGNGVAPAIQARRVGRWLSLRGAFLVGVSRPWPRTDFQALLGGEVTLFVRRSLAAQVHFARIEPDGVWTAITLDLGWVFPIDDLDLGVFLYGGLAIGCDTDCRELPPEVPRTEYQQFLAGAAMRLDWVLTRRLGIGAFFRLGWRNLIGGTLEVTPLHSGGVSFSFFL